MDQGNGYAIPMDPGRFFSTRTFLTRPMHQSIAEHIHLLLITAREEFGFDREFGCEVWEMDFETQHTSGAWSDQVAKGILGRLQTYEKRLTGIVVSCEPGQAEFTRKEGEQVSSRLKRKLTVRLTARIASTNELFRFADNVFMSPFSLD